MAEESLSGRGSRRQLLSPHPGRSLRPARPGRVDGRGPGRVVGPAGHRDRPRGRASRTASTPPASGPATPSGRTRRWSSAAPTPKAPAERVRCWPATGRAALSGVDLTYRHFGEGTSASCCGARASGGGRPSARRSSTAKGYYLFGNMRQTPSTPASACSTTGRSSRRRRTCTSPRFAHLHEAVLGAVLPAPAGHARLAPRRQLVQRVVAAVGLGRRAAHS